MSFTLVLILLLQVVFTLGISPILLGCVLALRQGDTRWIVQPYRDLFVSLSRSDQRDMVAWSLILVVILLVPVISLRAPLDWMSDGIFMWTCLMSAQLMLLQKKDRVLLLVGGSSLLFLLFAAFFLGGSTQSTVMLSNGLPMAPVMRVLSLAWMLLSVIVSSRVVVHFSNENKFSLRQWTLWTCFWVILLWGTALLFPSTLAFNPTPLALLMSTGFLVVKVLAAILIFLFASWLHQKLALRSMMIIGVLSVLGSVLAFSYLVVA